MKNRGLIPEARAELSKYCTRESLQKACSLGITITGIVIDYDIKEQYVRVDLGNGIIGIMPWKDSTVYDWTYPKSLEISMIPNQIISLLYKKVRVKVKSVSEDKIIVSRLDNMIEAWEIVKESSNLIYDAVVVGRYAYGVFFDIAEGLIAFCHVSNFSEARIHRLEDWIFVGSSSKVKIVNKDSTKMLCSRKEAYFDPKYQCSAYYCSQIVKVKIESPIEAYGVTTGYFVEVNPNITGIADVSGGLQAFRYGDQVLAFIKSIDKDKNRMKLRIIGG